MRRSDTDGRSVAQSWRVNVESEDGEVEAGIDVSSSTKSVAVQVGGRSEDRSADAPT
jgi:hypothetical protein